MPTYDYRCPDCQHEQEHFHGINEKPHVKCEECGKRMKKLMGKGAGVVFKGPGFYETDYRKKDKTNQRVIDAIKKNSPDDQLAEGGVRREDL